jgi:hypothetical protein
MDANSFPLTYKPHSTKPSPTSLTLRTKAVEANGMAVATVTHLTVHCGRTHRQHGGNKDKATHDVGQKQASEPATSLSFVHNMSHFKRSKSRYKRSGGYQTHLYCS